MRVLLMVPGSGGTFYCQNCLRDYALVRALRKAGHDAIMLPLYLPAFDGTLDPKLDAPMFFGGISMFMREKYALFRNAPRWLDRLIDSRWLLRQAASREGSTNAADLGSMTLSMLRGREGNQRMEFERLVEWAATQERMDALHISNALLLGFAPELKRVTHAPVVCSLQDEEPWVDAMRPPYNHLCWQAMARAAESVDVFVATSAWYADRMADKLRIPRERIQVVHLGVETEGVAPAEIADAPRTIGFLSRLHESLGLGTLVDAFVELRKDPAMRDLRLRATGGETPADRPFVDSLRERLRTEGLADAVEFLPDFSGPQRKAFLRSLSVLSVPMPEGEAFGMQLLEAMVHGVPVVQPNLGSYPEIIGATGGGMLYDPADPSGLVEALRSLLNEPVRMRELGARGRESVLARFSIDRVADDFARIYTSAAATGTRP